jgi:hypothetical protein
MGPSDSGHLAVSSSGWVAGLIKPAQRSGWPRDEAEGKPERAEAYMSQRFNLSRLGRPTAESQGFQPYPGNPAVRDYRGASGNVAMVEL